MSTDRIEREIKIAAPVDRVWDVLTNPAHVGVWFGRGEPADIDLRPGGHMKLDHGEHGSYVTVIVTVDRPRTFAYRWASAYPGAIATEENSTLVEFTLEPAGDGTLLRVVESGFDSLTIPVAREESAGFASHAKGWSGVVTKLGAYAEGVDDAPLLPPT
jgi:uncharacterized protein YndB with AHSA1/START domain